MHVAWSPFTILCYSIYFSIIVMAFIPDIYISDLVFLDVGCNCLTVDLSAN